MKFNFGELAGKIERHFGERSIFGLVGFFGVMAVIIFANVGWLPVSGMTEFAFVVFLSFALAVYNPMWAFWILISSVLIENINLAPENVGVSVRVYQLFLLMIIVSVAVKYLTKKTYFEKIRFFLADAFVLLLVLGSLLSWAGSQNKGAVLFQVIVLGSLSVLYFIARLFVKSKYAIGRILLFFGSSSLAAVLFGIWQNWRFSKGLSHFEVMPGRPNSVFSEPDWLGMFLVFLIATLCAVLFHFSKNKIQQKKELLGVWISFVLVCVLLVLTVARSAWLGAGVVFLGYGIIVATLTFVKRAQWRELFFQGAFLFSAIVMSFGVVSFFNLTNFELGNRLQSTESGLQEITVSCESDILLPAEIGNTEDLKQYECRHINLEEIDTEKEKGMFVKKISRKDPNVNIRAEIYAKSWGEIKAHPILGIGWGNISVILGQDERGAGLNSSNIFLEVWLGAGILGLLALVGLFSSIFFKAVNNFLKNNNAIDLWIILAVLAIIIPNLFNAGIMLGFIWLFLGLAAIED